MCIRAGRVARSRGPRLTRQAVLAIAVAQVGFSVAAHGATKTWSDGTGSWSVAANWGPVTGQPLAGDIVFLTQSDAITRTVTYDSGANTGTMSQLLIDATGAGGMSLIIPLTATQTISVTSLEIIGNLGKGFLQQSAGTQTISSTLFVGNNLGSVGTYQLSGTGSLTVNGNEIVGAAGAGTFNQSAGGHTIGSEPAPGVLAVGYFSGGTGNFILSGTGSLAINGEERIGSSGAGTFSQSSGTHTVGSVTTPGFLTLGYASGGAGTYLLSASGNLNTNGQEFIGADGAGTFNQTAGTHTVGSATVPGALYLGFGAGTGNYLLGGGTLAVNSLEFIGYASAGTFNQTVGLHTIGSASATGSLLLGVGTAVSGNYQLSGSGTLVVNGVEIVGFSGAGSVNQTAATHAIGTASAPGELNIAYNPGSSGAYLLSGSGSLAVIGSEFIGRSGTGTFSQTGGAHALGTASVPSDLSLGNLPDGSGTYLLSGTASLTVIGDESIGEAGTGTFTQSGGTHTLGAGLVARNRYIGSASGSKGRYFLSGSGLSTINGVEYIGFSGAGTFDQSGGTHTIGTPTVPGALHIGFNPGSAGTYLLSAAGALTVNGDEFLGEGGTATFNQTGGTHVIGSASAPSRLLVGAGSYSLGGTGSLSVFGDEIIGIAGTGRFSQSAGNHAIGSGSVVASLYVGAVAGSTGSFLLSGTGSLSITGDETIGASGVGTFTQNAGAHTIGTASAPRALYLGRFSGSSGTFALSGTGSLIVSGNVFVGGNATSANGTGLLDIGARATISGTLTAWNSPNTTVKVSGGTLTVAGVVNDAVFNQTAGITNAGNFDNATPDGGSVTVSGGTLTANRIRQGTVAISGVGRIKVNPNGGSAATSRVTTLSITTPASPLDLTNNDLVIDYSGANPVSTIRQMLIDKRIMSSFATATVGLGYAESTSLFSTFPATFSGQSVDSAAIAIKFTFLGDANLDGQVNAVDLSALATHWQQTSQPWVSGDFNYDGTVNINDLFLLATNWQAGVGAPLGPSFGEAVSSTGLFGASVPDPGLLPLFPALLGIFSRRRRRFALRA